MTVKERVLEAIRKNQRLFSNCAAVVGFSGGADSTALLHALFTLREELNLSEIVAVHVNHQLRGEESVKDAAFTKSFCETYNIPYVLYTYDVEKVAKETGKSIEECGRNLRYDAFRETASRFKNALVCTAHTANDNVETVLLHMCRGCGLHGLTGIPMIRGDIVRPLLSCTRNEIEAYCRDQGLSYVTDFTNADVTYSRNRVRHEVLPALQQINPDMLRAMLRLIGQAQQTEEYMEQELTRYLPALCTAQDDVFCKNTLLAMSETLQCMWLTKLFREKGIAAEEKHITQILASLPKSGCVTLPNGYRFRILKHTVSLVRGSHFDPVTIPVNVGEMVRFDQKIYRFSLISREEYEQKLNNCKFFFKNACDYDMISSELFLRRRKEGDTYRPAGRDCGKTLKKLFNEEAIPTEKRSAVPLLCDNEGILIPFGFACDERVKITEQTKKILVFEKTEE